MLALRAWRRAGDSIGPFVIVGPVIAQVLDDDPRYPERACPSGLQAGKKLPVTGRQESHPPQSDAPRTGETLRYIDERLLIHAHILGDI